MGEIKTFNKFKEEDALLYGALASQKDSKDPIDVAIFSKVKENSIDTKRYKIAEFEPFNPVSKRTEALVNDSEGKEFKVSKGATQVILSLTGESKRVSGEMNEYIDEFAKKGYRALGVAKTNESGNWRYIGLFGLYDPPREDSAETI